MSAKEDRRCVYHVAVTMRLETGVVRRKTVTPVCIKMRRDFYRCAVDGCPYVQAGETKMTSEDRFSSMEYSA